MIRYWDYSEKERAALTEEQVKTMLTVEMMEKGVLDPGPAPLKDEKPIGLPKSIYYKITYRDGYDKCLSVAFDTSGDAEEFIKLKPRIIDRDWSLGSDFEIAINPTKFIVQMVELYDQPDVLREKDRIKKVAADNKANEEAAKTHKEACEKRDKVTSGVWDDWHDCRRSDAKHKGIVETFNHYVKVADGNTRTALKFLAKAYPEPKIAEAFAWCGMSDPATEPELAKVTFNPKAACLVAPAAPTE